MSAKLIMDKDVEALLNDGIKYGEGELELPHGTYLPDSIERREQHQGQQERKHTQSIKQRKRDVEERLDKFVTLLRGASFEEDFLTNLDLKSREFATSVWNKLSHRAAEDPVRIFCVQTVSCGALTLYACKKTSEKFIEQGEFRKPSQMLLKKLRHSEQDRDDLCLAEIEMKLQADTPVIPLAKWLPRSVSLGCGSVGSSSGHSSPTSSIGMSSVSGIGMTLTPRIHSKNPLIKSLLPWGVIKGFAQSEPVSQIFESYQNQSDDSIHIGVADIYIFADCTAIALVRSLLQNERYIAHATQPSSPTKRRRDGSEERHALQNSDEYHDRTALTKAFGEYIHFIHEHASDLNPDEAVSVTTVIERHLQQLLPFAVDYLRECNFEGF